MRLVASIVYSDKRSQIVSNSIFVSNIKHDIISGMLITLSICARINVEFAVSEPPNLATLAIEQVTFSLYDCGTFAI